MEDFGESLKGLVPSLNRISGLLPFLVRSKPFVWGVDTSKGEVQKITQQEQGDV